MKGTSSMLWKFMLAGCLSMALWTGGPSAHATDISPEQARQIATEAYLYTYPLVLMEITRRMSINVESGARPGFGPMNQFSHMRTFPPGDFKEVVRPNFDTLYSIVWLDLTKEPVIVSAPDTQGRYYMLPMLDMWTDVIAVPGKRTSGTQAAHFAVTGPGWEGELPPGVTRISSPTPYVWVIGRTQTNGPNDYANVHKVQEGYKATPLSEWGASPRAVKAHVDPQVDMKTPPLIQIKNMSAKRYYTYAAELLKQHPPHATDGSIRLRLQRIGLEPGKSFDFDRLAPDIQEALAHGTQHALRLMQMEATHPRKVSNGWNIPTAVMGVYGNEYLQRAVVAMVGLGANPAEEAVYPMNVHDADGKSMVGGQQYVLHFAKDQLPPVDAFWSLTMYDADGFPVPNPIERYAIGDRDPLRFNPDGSLDIYIQPESPGRGKEANWLPSAKSGTLGLTMRLYMPSLGILTGKWVPPVVKRVD